MGQGEEQAQAARDNEARPTGTQTIKGQRQRGLSAPVASYCRHCWQVSRARPQSQLACQRCGLRSDGTAGNGAYLKPGMALSDALVSTLLCRCEPPLLLKASLADLFSAALAADGRQMRYWAACVR